MPSTRIAAGAWVRGREASIIEAVQRALSSALELPEWDRDVVLDCYDSGQRIVPAGRSERFTRIEVILFAGRSLHAKRNLYKALVDNLAAVGVPHPKWDERPLLLVKLKEGETGTKEEFLQFLEGKIAKWWMPDDVVFVDDIPLGATGKIDKKVLRTRLKDYRLPTLEPV